MLKQQMESNRIEYKSKLNKQLERGLPQGISENDFFDGISIPRNKEIMRIFKDLDLVEQLGSGIPRILQFYGKECFKFSDNFIRISFPISVIKENKTVGKTVGKTTHAILDLMKENPKITREVIANKLNLSVRGVEYHISKLTKENIIKREGGRKQGYWKVLN